MSNGEVNSCYINEKSYNNFLSVFNINTSYSILKTVVQYIT